MIKKLVRTRKHPSIVKRDIIDIDKLTDKDIAKMDEKELARVEEEFQHRLLLDIPDYKIRNLFVAVRRQCETLSSASYQTRNRQYNELTKRDLDYILLCTRETQKEKTW